MERSITDADTEATFERLMEFYSPKPEPSKVFAGDWLTAMADFPTSILQQAYRHATENDNRFPTLSLFRSYCIHFSEEADKRRHEAQGRATSEAAEAFYRADLKGNDFGKQALKNIRDMLAGSITRGQYLKTARVLGMFEEADNLEKFYTDGDLPLDGKCRGIV